MSKPITIDYYFAPQSPWTYLGHQRFVSMAAAAGVAVNVRPVNLGGAIFPATGGLPLNQRPPQRLAYRLLELARFRDALGVPLNLKPKFFPVPADSAARLIIAIDNTAGPAAALDFSGRALAAVWAQERDINDAATLAELLQEAALPASCLDAAQTAEVQADYDRFTQQALAAGVFGAPSYVIDGEIFWGQDRLDFVQRRLAAM